MDWYLEAKIWAEDRQYSSCPLIQETKANKILKRLIWMYHVVYLHNAWKRHQHTVFWVNINLAIRKEFNILPNSIECDHFSRNTSSLLYSKSYQIEIWRSFTRKSKHVTSTSAKDHIETRLDKIGFKSCSTTARWEENFFDKQNSSNQPNQSQNQSVIDQGNLVTWSQKIKEKSSHEELCSSDRSGQPDITRSVNR